MPGLRALEKYAVRAGGGANHRFGLDDAVLIKDNHVAAAGGVAPGDRRARAGVGHLVKIEVEVDPLDQLDEALAEKRRRRAARQHGAGDAGGGGATHRRPRHRRSLGRHHAARRRRRSRRAASI